MRCPKNDLPQETIRLGNGELLRAWDETATSAPVAFTIVSRRGRSFSSRKIANWCFRLLRSLRLSLSFSLSFSHVVFVSLLFVVVDFGGRIE